MAAAPEEQAVEPAPSTAAHSRRPAAPDEMRVSASSNPTSLASAISHAIYDNKQVTLRAIGAGAICQTMKAFAIARGFVAPRGFDIAVIPGWANAIGNQGDELSAMTFKVIQLG